jgi:hypothetical protein
MFKEIHLASIDAAHVIGDDYHMPWWIFYPMWYVAILICFRPIKKDDVKC